MNEDKPSVMPPVPPFVRFVASAVPMVFDDSLSYYEALCALWKYVSDMTDVINNNATLEEEYILKFNELKDFVDNYFENLDVQEEINNKLDAMVEDGTLPELINNFLQPNVAWTFDTVADMKLFTNFENGCFARTLGFNALNDGGGALYKISNTGTANEMDVIAVGTLNAHLVHTPVMSVKQFGVKGDGSTDESSLVTALIASLPSVVKELVFDTAGALYLEDCIEMEEIDGLTLTFKNRIHRASSASNNFGFKLTECYNLVFNELDIYSERDQTEPAPADHTRVSSAGSNIDGVIMYECSHITFNAPKFENMASDFFNQPSLDSGKSNDITINNWYSRNTSLPLFMQFIDNVYINNADVIPAEEMGDGDHFLYFSKNTNNVYVNNCHFKVLDSNFGSSINWYNTGDDASALNCPKNLFVDGCVIIGARNVISMRFASNAIITNSLITCGNTRVVYLENSSSLIMDNCTVDGDYTHFHDHAASGTLEVKNCNISSSAVSPSQLIILSGSSVEPYVYFKNNKIVWNDILFYSGSTVDAHIIFKDNIVNQAQNNTYNIGVKKATSEIKITGNIITNSVNKTNFIYNNTAMSNFYVYFNIIKGYTKVANDTDIATINNDYNKIEANS